ncbi:MAG: phosphatase PAP2 family protein [Alphaproteobacteria bacterium]|nr:phosphatase PAP2 family protein [Alphaproteobacteria bacterium]MBU1514759.1 phosphatase PAP2 family protein [Alphaproteobacteria bacterium]MBU2153317.1 phosphatase PAP2 family protein [Alphaproteobacteria bacterium]MBU2309745.1 phosphatase PAP2 family protein [Alphaproteobacteria bacterium]MBU2361871.1 phosphatase PAP2 family protein [Alphaproteobacteria bacterium]
MLRVALTRVWDFFKRFETWVLVGLILAAGALWAFLNIADEMAEGETQGIDSRIILMLREPGDLNNPIGSKNVEEAVRDITALGGTTLVAVVTVVAILAFLFHKKRLHALVMGVVVLAAWGSSQGTKALYDRPRPDLVPHEAYVYSASFPSGHSTMSAAAFLTLAMLIASLEPRRRNKALAYAVAGIFVVGVGFSRVYLGVHWPTDVLAGWCLGAMWALVGWIALRAMHAPTRGA